jgi:hypothetical protein
MRILDESADIEEQIQQYDADIRVKNFILARLNKRLEHLKELYYQLINETKEAD